MAQKKEQWFMIIAASLFLAGAVFMLVNTFGAQEWALWVGIALALCAVLLYVIVEIARFRFNKKYGVRESEIVAKQQKVAEPMPATSPVIKSESAPQAVVKEQAKQKAAKSNKSQKKSSKKPNSKKKK